MSPTITDKLTSVRLDRRQILKGAGALSAVGIVSALMPTIASADEEQGQTGYQFLNLSDGKGAMRGSALFMNGIGRVGTGVAGGGDYVIFNAANGSALDFGSWKAKRLNSFANVGTTVAGFLGATLTMDVVLKSTHGGRADATATVNCDDGAISPDGGNGTGDVLTLVIRNGALKGTFGPGSELGPFNVTIFTGRSD